MDCYEKHSLRRKFTLYVRAYSEAVGKLLAVTSEATRSEWALAWELIALAFSASIRSTK